MAGSGKLVLKSAGLLVTVYEVIRIVAEEILEILRRRKKEKTTKFLESEVNESFLYFMKQMEPLNRVYKKLGKFTRYELHLLIADPEKNPGKKEEEIARVLKSRLKKNLKDLSQRIQTLEEDVREWPESTKLDLQVLRADLEKNPGNEEEEIARALESRMEKVFQHLSQIIETLEEASEESQTPEEGVQKRKGFQKH